MNLKEAVIQEVAICHALGMHYAPGKDEATLELTIRSFISELLNRGLTDEDSGRVIKAWNNCRSNRSEWPTPADLFKAMPKHRHEVKALEHKDEEFTAERLERNRKAIKRISEKASKGQKVDEQAVFDYLGIDVKPIDGGELLKR